MKIGIAGCGGKMGKMLVSELQNPLWLDKFTLISATSRTPSSANIIPGCSVTEDAASMFTSADAVIDFTRPEATRDHATLAARNGKILIVGTTGLSAEDEAILSDAAQKTAIVYAGNMSLGVTLLHSLVEKAARALGPDWDIEISETHHRHKIDAPSGTALMLGRAAAQGRGYTLDSVAEKEPRFGDIGPRKRGTIGFTVQRGGDVIGEHSVSFFAEGERLVLSHIATDRALFARGALKAALWAKEKPPGLYSMRDVLEL